MDTSPACVSLAKYPEGDGRVHLDYQRMRPEHSSHVAKDVLLLLRFANAHEI
jgi:hypothetical protein